MKILYLSLIILLAVSCTGGPRRAQQSEPPVEAEPPELLIIEDAAGEQHDVVELPDQAESAPEISMGEPDELEEPETADFPEDLPEEIVQDFIPDPAPEEAPEIIVLPEPELEPLLPEPEIIVQVPVQEPFQEPPAAIVQEPAPGTMQEMPPQAPIVSAVVDQEVEPEPLPPEEPMTQPDIQSPAEQSPAIVREPVPSRVSPAPVVPIPEAGPDYLGFAWPRELQEEIVFSRIVRATVGQLVEIPFRGTGWVYLGELASRRGVIYDSRRLDPEGQSFIFRTDAAGTFALKFYKQDFIRDFILNDYVQVIVGEPPVSRGSGWFNPPVDLGRVIAEPRWPTTLDEAELRRGAERLPPMIIPPSGQAMAASPPVQSAGAQASGTLPAETTPGPESSGYTAPETSESIAPDVLPPTSSPEVSPPAETDNTFIMPAGSMPEDYLRTAREFFDEGRVAAAISVLDQFRLFYPSGSDEAYWLYGQFYEANTPSRDILLALDYYRRLVREYPQSGRYNDARRRIAYLERYYINIQ
ncbi:MAG: hypothetical protein FWG99_06575 [Treponema sp.]|nr:hypothetical protein [Treponema sp.]